MDKKLKEHGKQLREQIYQFIIGYILENGYAPTFFEIGNAVGLKSKANVHSHLTKLEIEGKIKIKPYSPRAIKVIGWEYRKVEE